MKFAELYKNNKNAVSRVLTSLWCGEAHNDSQRATNEQMHKIIQEIFAPEEAKPVVQCMNLYKIVYSVPGKRAEEIVAPFWDRISPPGKDHYFPYEHQYQSWHTLLKETNEEGKPMSMVVTTGTGSGKTECFMLPLVYDLTNNKKNNQVQALFLYPLNALMEDQKERLEKLIEGTGLTYAVYNGDLPEREPNPEKTDAESVKTRRKIEQIRGAEYDNDGNFLRYRFPNMLYTREQVRKTPPNILLTNPTMLEYILLREADRPLINEENKSLKWVVIDETHTYTGAGAAEMAMLLRRVFLAFGVKATDIRFATSSATFGNGEAGDEDEKLRKFISGITGTSESQVKVIKGERRGLDNLPNNEDRERWEMICKQDYVSLDNLFPEGSVEEKLKQLDAMCDRLGNDDEMKIKVHFFYRVPNNGLYVKLTEFADGCFRIYQHKTLEDKTFEKGIKLLNIEEDAPFLELSKCKSCGEYVAVARLNTETGEYETPAMDDTDIFDLPDPEDDAEEEKKIAIFGLSRDEGRTGDNNARFKTEGDKIVPLLPDEYRPGQWYLVGNTQGKCPYCNRAQTKKKDNGNPEGDEEIRIENTKLQRFRLSPDFISRIIAPTILDQLDKYKRQPGEEAKIILHDGQQYLSFADSRQMAAKATLNQNLEQERLWFYSTIYHELCRRKVESESVEKEIAKKQQEIQQLANKGDFAGLQKLVKETEQLSAGIREYMTWEEIADLFMNDPLCTVFASLSVKRSTDSEELDEKGMIRQDVIRKYIHSMMVMYLSRRPNSAASAETLGLFQPYYKRLEDLQIPESVEKFNSLLDEETNKISAEDWRNFIQIFIDYTVRSNQWVYLSLPKYPRIDIFACERFAAEKPHRRSAKKPEINPTGMSGKNVLYLADIIARDKGINRIEALRNYQSQIAEVIDDMWKALTEGNNALLTQSTKYDDKSDSTVNDKEGALRLNLAEMSVTLFSDTYLADANSDGGTPHVSWLRPVGVNFKHYSPYLQGNTPVLLNNDKQYHEEWEPFPMLKSETPEETEKLINNWAKEKRTILWNNDLWGENGIFADRLRHIHNYPNLFIQSEHTAQVDKSVSRQLQADFKEHTINILACSTTMEMGVDLGNLEAVMLSSVPPQPSNYKQRAGRSGRNNKIKSVCITLCGSDMIGLRTLYNPIEKIISREVRVPTVDLMSPQVIQRHANSFLVRAFGVFSREEEGGSLQQKVIDYYTNLHFDDMDGYLTVMDSNHNPVNASAQLGNPTGTPYEAFNLACMDMDPSIFNQLKELLKDTIFEGEEGAKDVVKTAQQSNELRYAELSEKTDNIAIELKNIPALKLKPESEKKYRHKLNWKYIEVLDQRLLNFWATNRFTPNANMPVNVLPLDLNTAKSTSKRYNTKDTSANPSYSLREAIAQYVPGNTIVVDGVVYTVRGVALRDQYSDKKSLKQIYRGPDKVAIDNLDSVAGAKKWEVNNKLGLELVQPVGFLPDMNEQYSRIIGDNVFTQVNAQLIGASDWNNSVGEPHLFSVRPNVDSGMAKILYYNQGIGYGYSLCTKCGRMALETEAADNRSRLPEDMNPYRPSNPEKPRFHYEIDGKEKKTVCYGSRDRESIRRNVIIGDLIQTDYSEIRFRHKGQKKWMNSLNDKNKKLLVTLALVFTQSLADVLGKERNAVDFAITPNGHIVIFDTNPGGAGYSNQLANIQVMHDIISNSKKLLEEAKQKKSKDLLLDKYTLRFQKDVDIQEALDWIEEEYDSCNMIPKEIEDLFPNQVTETNLIQLLRAFVGSNQVSWIFADDQYKDWDYLSPEHGWRATYFGRFSPRHDKTVFCVMTDKPENMPKPIRVMARQMDSWCRDVVNHTNVFAIAHIYPLAYIDGILYFTTEEDKASLNNMWAKGTIYCTKADNLMKDATKLDLSYKPSTKLIRLSGSENVRIKTRELAAILEKASEGIIEEFIDYAKSSGKAVSVCYQDDFLRSIVGMVLTLQTIEYFVSKIGNEFSLQFKFEEYDNGGSRLQVMGNLPNSAIRDTILTQMTDGWLNSLDVTGTLIPIKSLPEKALPHWRELSFVCGDKKLSIYPDGGFMNGWNLDNRIDTTGQRPKFYTPENTNTSDNISLYRKEDIKFDIDLQEE